MRPHAPAEGVPITGEPESTLEMDTVKKKIIRFLFMHQLKLEIDEEKRQIWTSASIHHRL